MAFDSAPTADSEIYSKLDHSVRDAHESQVSYLFLMHDNDPLVMYFVIIILNSYINLPHNSQLTCSKGFTMFIYYHELVTGYHKKLQGNRLRSS